MYVIVVEERVKAGNDDTFINVYGPFADKRVAQDYVEKQEYWKKDTFYRWFIEEVIWPR